MFAVASSENMVRGSDTSIMSRKPPAMQSHIVIFFNFSGNGTSCVHTHLKPRMTDKIYYLRAATKAILICSTPWHDDPSLTTFLGPSMSAACESS